MYDLNKKPIWHIYIRIMTLAHRWDYQVLYTLGHACSVQQCHVVGLREPRKSDGVSD